MNLIEKEFSFKEFLEEFKVALSQSYQLGIEKYQIERMPKDFKLYMAVDSECQPLYPRRMGHVRILARCIFSIDEGIKNIFRQDDFYFPKVVYIRPFATNENYTFFEITWSNEWVNKVEIDKLPFRNGGIGFPPTWLPNESSPKLILPYMEIIEQ